MQQEGVPVNKFKEILKLTRIEHSLMLVVAVLAAELLSGGLPSLGILLLSLITPVFISMGSFAVNDYYDIKVDKLNHKDRPLVTRTLKPADAAYVYAISFVIGIVSSAFINGYAFGITEIFALLAFFYSYKLKEMFLVGNAYIALTMVIPFIFGVYVVGGTITLGIALICVMVFLSGLAREIHGTIRDYDGDVRERSVRNIPMEVGVRSAALIALVLYAVAVLISVYLFLAVAPFMNNMIYAVMVAVSDVMLLYVGLGYAFKRRNLASFYDGSRNVSLFGMGLALFAILLSALFYI